MRITHLCEQPPHLLRVQDLQKQAKGDSLSLAALRKDQGALSVEITQSVTRRDTELLNTGS